MANEKIVKPLKRKKQSSLLACGRTIFDSTASVARTTTAEEELFA